MTCLTRYCVCDTLMDPWNVCLCMYACVTWTGTILLLAMMGSSQKRIFQKRDLIRFSRTESVM